MSKQARKQARIKAVAAQRSQDAKLNKLLTTPKRKLKLPPPSNPQTWD